MFAAGWLLGRMWAENNKITITNEDAHSNRDKDIIKNAICTYIQNHPNSTGGDIARAFSMSNQSMCGYLVVLQKEERIKKIDGFYKVIEEK